MVTHIHLPGHRTQQMSPSAVFWISFRMQKSNNCKRWMMLKKNNLRISQTIMPDRRNLNQEGSIKSKKRIGGNPMLPKDNLLVVTMKASYQCSYSKISFLAIKMLPLCTSKTLHSSLPSWKSVREWEIFVKQAKCLTEILNPHFTWLAKSPIICWTCQTQV